MSVVLSTSGLHAGYGAGDILKGIDLALDEGRILTLIGPNGSGKSTLVKTLAGLLEARQGDVLFAGERVNGWSPPRRVKGGLAYVPQDMAQPHIAKGQLDPVLEDWWAAFPGYHLYYPKRRQLSRAMSVVIDALRQPATRK